MSETTPGLRRLRANPAAESIRHSVLADQQNGRADAAARIEAAKSLPGARKTPAAAKRASAPKTAKGGYSPAPTPKACAKAAKPASGHAKGKRAAMLASAEAGVIPSAPDFTAETHKRFRAKLAAVVALVEAGDVEALRAYQYAGFVSSSPRAILKYRDLALVALEARAARAAA
jgi:hypothetical protein